MGVRRRGFLLSLALAEEVKDKEAFVKTNLSAKLEYVEDKYGMSTYKVDKKEVDLGELLQTITKLQDQEVITKWSVSQSSLDDVFIRVCQAHERQ